MFRIVQENFKDTCIHCSKENVKQLTILSLNSSSNLLLSGVAENTLSWLTEWFLFACWLEAQ